MEDNIVNSIENGFSPEDGVLVNDVVGFGDVDEQPCPVENA